MIVIVILIILAVVGSETEALKQNLAEANKGPSPEHWFGTDQTGATSSRARSSAAGCPWPSASSRRSSRP